MIHMSPHRSVTPSAAHRRVCDSLPASGAARVAEGGRGASPRPRRHEPFVDLPSGDESVADAFCDGATPEAGRLSQTRRRKLRRVMRCALVFLTGVSGWAAAGAEDWPTYMHDGARSGVTAEQIGTSLTEQWIYRAPAEPRPAWPDPQHGWTELPKVKFDDAFYTTAVGDKVFFGSSVDDQIYALDAKTGAVRWKFFTGGPVRLAPSVDNGRVFAGSDDGNVYCLGADDGRLIWKFQVAPESRRVVGNGRIISLWPVRTSVMVENGRVYCGAGVFPYHRTLMAALNAADGKLLWRSDTLGNRWGFSPQGYLLSCERGLIVPCGRATPVCVDRDKGEVAYVALPTEKGDGGTYSVVVGKKLYAGTQTTLRGYDTDTGTPRGKWSPAERLLAGPDAYFVLQGPAQPAYGHRSVSEEKNAITAYDRRAWDTPGAKDAAAIKAATRWKFARPELTSMILAGDRIIAGADNEVFVLDAKTGASLWSGKVDGRAVGLAVAQGRLLVSTTKGRIHCFAPGAAHASAPDVARQPPPSPAAAQAAQRILKETGLRKGYALIIGDDAAALAEGWPLAVLGGRGSDAQEARRLEAIAPLACELAKQSELHVVCVAFGAPAVERARIFADASGLYGTRVSVIDAAPNLLPFPDFAANLIVQIEHAGYTAAPRELQRVLKPCGGVLLTGWLSGPWKKTVRGELEGSGWWSHPFADAGNSGSSADQRVKGRLEVLWFGEPGANEFPDRHQRGVAPLMVYGRVFCQGWEFSEKKNTVFCFDAYNGVRYWEREIPGAARLYMPSVSGNIAATADSLFVAAHDKCFRLDATTGETKATFTTPRNADGTTPAWLYLGVADGLLLGSTENPNRPKFSDAVFAHNIETGSLLWTYRGREIRDTTIAYENKRVFFVEDRHPKPPPPPQPAKPKTKTKAATTEHGFVPEAKQAGPMPRTIVALNAVRGKIAWEKEADLSNCGRWDAGNNGHLHALCKDGVLVLGGAYSPYGARKGDEPLRRAMAISTRDGSQLWCSPVGNLSRPLVMHGALLADPVFHDLRTGEKLVNKNPKTGRETVWSSGPRTGGCGSISASDSMVFMRSGFTIWRDVLSGGTSSFTGVRPGCFINIIPAGGVVVQAEASSGCSCYHAVQGTVVFKPVSAE